MSKIALIGMGLLLGTSGIVSRCEAQTANEESKPQTAFEATIPHPTGLNGYEELVMAGDLLQGNELSNAAQIQNTLEAKRKALASPNIKRALELLRIGLNKPIMSPRDPSKLDENTRFLELSEFRNLARLLAIEGYVRLADGNVSGAIDSVNDGLLLGHAVQVDSLISGLVGIAIDAISLNLLARHIPQLSLRDCDRVIRLCEEWLKVSPPAAHIITTELNATAHFLKKFKATPDKLAEMFAASPGEEQSDTEKALQEHFQHHPEEIPQLFEDAIKTANDYYDKCIEDVKRPAWERKGVAFPKENTPVGALIGMLVPALSTTTDKYDQIQADFHLLGTFAALRRYQWVYGHLPADLKELREPNLTQDPYTGQPLLYKRDGDAYDLHCAGPYTHQNADNPLSGPRSPMYLPYRKPQ